MESITQGTLVADRYRMIREIGFGGMGTVWLAYDTALDSQCAIKLIGAIQAREEEFLIRFECEAKCAAQLRGAHVVDVLNRGQWQGKPFIVMEYLEGEDLAVRLERVGRLDARTTYRIVAQVARALMRAHALGIVHRDIKPGNIFLVPGDDHEVAKVLDFGVAKHRALPNAFEGAGGQFIGTPCYMSPEQACGKAVDARTDLWALAVITFECLTGALPFQDESVLDMIQSIAHGAVPRLTENRPDLPAELEYWWQRATARDPQRRFQSAKEFADGLAEAVGVYPMPVSGFPAPIADVPSLPDPLSVMPPSRRAARAVCALAPNSFETDAAVTVHSGARSSSARLESVLRGRRRRVSPYLFAGSGLCAMLLLAATTWRPTLGEVISGFGLDAGRNAAPLPHIAEIGQSAESLPVEASHTAPRASASAEELVATLPVNTAEPSVRVEPRSPLVNASVPVKKANAAAHTPNHWRPLAPPVSSASEAPLEPSEPAPAAEKDYGI